MTVGYRESYEGKLRELIGQRRLIIPAVRAVITTYSDEVLLVRRADDLEWSMPAGAVELCESVRQALVREVREETGLTVEEAVLVAVQSYWGTNHYGNHYHRLVHVCWVRGWSGTLMTSTSETVDARFFTLNHLPPLASIYRETLGLLRRFSGRVEFD
jgi:ADP-ribose pyrophosphatase YjhB (NUDIX family)